MKNYRAGLLGCGDFLRWEISKINESKHFTVKYTYDKDASKSDRRARDLKAVPAESAEAIFCDPDVDVVLIFTPAFARRDYFKRAAETGKHIITTKPLALTYVEGKLLSGIVKNKVQCAVFYRRSGDAVFETLKQILESGEIGKLGLYKEDWFHNAPHWNTWALDPEKNGGPFMDAMVHNLNISRYLAGSPVSDIKFLSENYAQNLSCNDTEFMRVRFESGGGAYLFISWAANLEVYDVSGNDREHFGIMHLITSEGWYVTVEEENGQRLIKAKKQKEIRHWPVENQAMSCYDDFVFRVENSLPQNSSLEMALEDIRILEMGMKG